MQDEEEQVEADRESVASSVVSRIRSLADHNRSRSRKFESVACRASDSLAGASRMSLVSLPRSSGVTNNSYLQSERSSRGADRSAVSSS